MAVGQAQRRSEPPGDSVILIPVVPEGVYLPAFCVQAGKERDTMNVPLLGENHFGKRVTHPQGPTV